VFLDSKSSRHQMPVSADNASEAKSSLKWSNLTKRIALTLEEDSRELRTRTIFILDMIEWANRTFMRIVSRS
jgi:hypothetical protein